MERFAAMVAGRGASPALAPKHKSAPAAEQDGDEKYLRIQLEEIVIVKDDAYDALAAATAAARAHGNGNGIRQCSSGSATASAFMEKCGKAAAAVRGGGSTRVAAARGASTTTVARIGDFD